MSQQLVGCDHGAVPVGELGRLTYKSIVGKHRAGTVVDVHVPESFFEV